MAVTVDLVKKLILEYIGGQKVFGNPVNVIIDGKRVVTQTKSLVSAVTGQLGGITDIAGVVSGLVQNPLGAITDQLGSTLQGALGSITDLALPTDLQDLVDSAFGDMTSVLGDLVDHTNLLSGILPDNLEDLPIGKATISDLMSLTDTTAIEQMAGSLFQDKAIAQIEKSFNSSYPGGVTDLVSQLAQVTEYEDQARIVDNLTKVVNDHKTQIQTIIDTDDTYQTAYKLQADVNDTVSSFVPTVQNKVFDLVATPALKQVVQEIVPDDTVENAVHATGTIHLDVTTVAGSGGGDDGEVPEHTHSTDDIINLTTFVQTLIDAAIDEVGGVTLPIDIDDVTGLQANLDSKASTSHNHAISDVTGLQANLDSKAASSHNHAISDVTGLQANLDAKAATSHTHTIANITGLQANLESRANLHLTITTISNSSYEFVLADDGCHLRFTNTSSHSATVPNNSVVAFSVGTRIRGTSVGNTTTLIAGSGVTLNSRDDSLTSAGIFSVWEITKVATNEWDVLGDMA